MPSTSEGAVPDRRQPARILQRRTRAKINYRRRRDRKIGVDWLGRWFELSRLIPINHTQVEGEMGQVRMQVVGYDPGRSLIEMYNPIYNIKEVWTTDQFWTMLRNGSLVQS